MKLSGVITATIRDTMVVFLEDFTNAMAVGDRQTAAVAASKVAQLGLSVYETFSSGCEAICSTEQDRAACHAAAVVVRNLMEKHLEDWYQNSKTDKERTLLAIN